MNSSSRPRASTTIPGRHVGADDVLKGAAVLQDLPGAGADPQVFFIERDEAVVGIEQGEPFLQACDGAAESLLASAQRCLGLFAFGDFLGQFPGPFLDAAFQVVMGVAELVLHPFTLDHNRRHIAGHGVEGLAQFLEFRRREPRFQGNPGFKVAAFDLARGLDHRLHRAHQQARQEPAQGRGDEKAEDNEHKRRPLRLAGVFFKLGQRLRHHHPPSGPRHRGKAGNHVAFHDR